MVSSVTTRARARATGVSPSPPLPASMGVAKRLRACSRPKLPAPAPSPPQSPCSSASLPPSPTRPVRAAAALSLAHESGLAPEVRRSEGDALRAVLSGDGLRSAYVCGTPGAGKTMTVGRLLREAKEDGIVESAFVVNCTGLGKPAAFYAAVGDVLGVGRAKEDLVRATTEGRGIVVLMLDEVDFLPQKLLYEVYELPALPRSRIAIIGIANRLDLPLKSLPLLTATNRAPRVISFKPYTADDLTAIVRARLSDSGEGADAVLHPVAITLAAKKIASMSGDARRMLDVCREALLAVHESAGANPIGIVSALLSRAGRTTAAVDTVRTLPVQHQLALCCVANAEKRMVAAAERGSVASHHFAKRITIGGLYESFKAMCVKTTIPCLGISDFTDMIESMAVSHALLHISDVKRTKAGGVGGGRGERGRVVRLDTASIADVQSGCSDTPLLRLLVGNEL